MIFIINDWVLHTKINTFFLYGTNLFGSGVKLFIHFLQRLKVAVGIDLGGCKRAMSQHLFDAVDICAIIEKVCG